MKTKTTKTHSTNVHCSVTSEVMSDLAAEYMPGVRLLDGEFDNYEPPFTAQSGYEAERAFVRAMSYGWRVAVTAPNR